MDAEAAKLIGAGLAAIGAGMAAIGVGNVFGSFLESALRNPAAADGQPGRLFIGFAAAELLGLLSFLIALLLSLKAAWFRLLGLPAKQDPATAFLFFCRNDVVEGRRVYGIGNYG